MANVNNPYGLKPAMRTGAGGNPQCLQYTKAVGYAQAIYKWDPVTLLAGVLNGPASGITPGTTRYAGVALNWAAASTASVHQVMVDPDSLFDAQGDGSGSGSNTIALAHMGFNANLNLTGTAGGGTTRDNSGVQITESTIATTSTLDVRLLNLLVQTDNAYGIYGRVMLKFNKHLLNPEVTAT